MSTSGLTLHEAMLDVLRANGGGWMARDDIAAEIERRDLFRKPSDGAHPPSDQLRLRARKYPHLFECNDSRCSRIRARVGAASDRPRTRSMPPRPKRVAPKPRRARVPAPETEWYEDLRERYRPAILRYLLVGESPPDPGDGERRFFYSPTLSFDNLYRGVAEAVYGERDEIDLRDKSAVLELLQRDGFWLIDAVEYPVNKLGARARQRAIKDGVSRLIELCAQLAPKRGVIVCHGKVYAAVHKELRDAGVPVLHDNALPFPLGNWRAQFVAGFRRALDN